jgi:REP-associated tyrosine transposase
MRKPRLEIEGGLYHIITRGNNRQLVFRSDDDRDKFLRELAKQKAKLPFYLYAYCLMPNHVHLLMERQRDVISRIMQRLLTVYSQYHNRKYRKTGHLLQGRYKAIICESDRYLGELVRYIHLNPVRARMVKRPEDFAYSSHRAYIGSDQAGWLTSIQSCGISGRPRS